MKDFLINGSNTSGLDPFDRGLAYGDGVFRTFKVINGKPLHWDYHFQTLSYDCEKLGIKLPNEALLLDDIKILFTRMSGTFIAKWIITRGSSDRGYSIPKDIKPNRILLKNKFTPLPESLYLKGVNLEFSSKKTSSLLQLGATKHLNRLENVLAKQAVASSSFDAIMFDENDHVNECTSHNILALFDKQIHMPKHNHAGVSGVSRQIVVDHAQSLGYAITESNLSRNQLLKANEIVIINSVNGALPVKQIKNKKWNSLNLAYELNQLLKKIK